MTIKNVWRHLLNVHLKVAYRCPLCVMQNLREEACVRLGKCTRFGKDQIDDFL